MSGHDRELYEFGDFHLDVGERRIERVDGAAAGTLPEKSFQTLVYLVRNGGRLITKEELLTSVWPDTIVEENNLGKAIHAIRQCLGDSSAHPVYIETVPKHGYRFVALVKAGGGSDDKVGEPFPPASDSHAARSLDAGQLHTQPTPQPSPIDYGDTRHTRLKVAIPAAALLLLLGALVGWIAMGRVGLGSTDPAERASGKEPDADPQRTAYDLYVRGKVKVASENREDTIAAMDLLQEAVALNPNLAEAYAQLARAHNTMAFKFSSGEARKKHHENAEVAIEKALQLNPELAEAHFARGLILWSNSNRFPHEQAIKAYKRSLAIEPNSDETHHQLSLIYSHIGMDEEALKSVRKALELNPNNTLARFRVGVYLQYQGKFDEALEVFKSVPREHTPILMDRSLAETLIQLKRYKEAEVVADGYLQQFPQDEGGSMTSIKAVLLAKTGRWDEAEQTALRSQQIGSGYGHFHHTAYNIAQVYVETGKHDEALAWLEKTVETGFPNYTYFALDPNLEKIRGDARFRDFMVRLKRRWERFRSELVGVEDPAMRSPRARLKPLLALMADLRG